MLVKTRYSFDQYLVLFAVFFSIVVVLLGAFCRLADSGLGCPDWPGCYGHLTSVPQSSHEVAFAASKYPTMPPLSPERMWPEMVHRYFAGTLSLLVLFIIIRAKTLALNKKRNCFYLAVFAGLLVIFQALLGMWTVTLKLLPIVVMGHLLGGFILTSMLWWIVLFYWQKPNKPNFCKRTKIAAWIIAFVVFSQILLGGWTSSNYAALICPDFPFCRGSLFPGMDISKGFTFFTTIGLNYEFGLLGEKARIAIQMIHRWGALITVITICFFGAWIVKKNQNKTIKSCVLSLYFILFLQVVLGVLNIKMLLPIEIAVAHNGVGLLLLLGCVTLCFFSQKDQ